MTDNDRLERFADLVVRVGVNVQPGSGVLLGSDIAHLEIARAVVARWRSSVTMSGSSRPGPRRRTSSVVVSAGRR
jgi:Thermophilic metalloprotease (M29)